MKSPLDRMSNYPPGVTQASIDEQYGSNYCSVCGKDIGPIDDTCEDCDAYASSEIIEEEE